MDRLMQLLVSNVISLRPNLVESRLPNSTRGISPEDSKAMYPSVNDRPCVLSHLLRSNLLFGNELLWSKLYIKFSCTFLVRTISLLPWVASTWILIYWILDTLFALRKHEATASCYTTPIFIATLQISSLIAAHWRWMDSGAGSH